MGKKLTGTLRTYLALGGLGAADGGAADWVPLEGEGGGKR